MVQRAYLRPDGHSDDHGLTDFGTGDFDAAGVADIADAETKGLKFDPPTWDRAGTDLMRGGTSCTNRRTAATGRPCPWCRPPP